MQRAPRAQAVRPRRRREAREQRRRRQRLLVGERAQIRLVPRRTGGSHQRPADRRWRPRARVSAAAPSPSAPSSGTPRPQTGCNGRAAPRAYGGAHACAPRAASRAASARRCGRTCRAAPCRRGATARACGAATMRGRGDGGGGGHSAVAWRAHPARRGCRDRCEALLFLLLPPPFAARAQLAAPHPTASVTERSDFGGAFRRTDGAAHLQSQSRQTNESARARRRRPCWTRSRSPSASRAFQRRELRNRSP